MAASSIRVGALGSPARRGRADAGEAVLSISGVEKSYGRIKALRGVDLTVHAGEVVALLGPNGAGKSTLLQILTGLFSPDEGRTWQWQANWPGDATPAQVVGMGAGRCRPSPSASCGTRARA